MQTKTQHRRELKHRRQKCNNCNGKGYIIVEKQRITCGICNGQGWY